MSTAPFSIQPELTAIAIAYRNPAYALIADLVMPRQGAPLTKKEFLYNVYNLADGYTVPDTLVGRRGVPNEVTCSAEEKTASVKDYGLDLPVPLDDITQAKGTPFNPLGSAVEHLTNLINLDRERRVATIASRRLLCASNVQTRSATTCSMTPYSYPVAILTEALDTPNIRPNSITLQRWGVLAAPPKLVKTIYPNGNGEGVVTRQQVADLLEVGEILVGESFANTAKPGQAASLARVWGNHIAMQFKDPSAALGQGVTWGLTARFGDKIAGTHRTAASACGAASAPASAKASPRWWWPRMRAS
jgi:hypothetical protein